jgi:hypothetical protein
MTDKPPAGRFSGLRMGFRPRMAPSLGMIREFPNDIRLSRTLRIAGHCDQPEENVQVSFGLRSCMLQWLSGIVPRAVPL